MYPLLAWNMRLASNPQRSASLFLCIYCLSAGIGMCHHTWLFWSFLMTCHHVGLIVLQWAVSLGNSHHSVLEILVLEDLLPLLCFYKSCRTEMVSVLLCLNDKAFPTMKLCCKVSLIPVKLITEPCSDSQFPSGDLLNTAWLVIYQQQKPVITSYFKIMT